MYGPDVTIFTHVWVSRYETHRFLQVDGGQRDPWVLGRHNDGFEKVGILSYRVPSHLSPFFIYPLAVSEGDIFAE